MSKTKTELQKLIDLDVGWSDPRTPPDVRLVERVDDYTGTARFMLAVGRMFNADACDGTIMAFRKGDYLKDATWKIEGLRDVERQVHRGPGWAFYNHNHLHIGSHVPIAYRELRDDEKREAPDAGASDEIRKWSERQAAKMKRMTDDPSHIDDWAKKLADETMAGMEGEPTDAGASTSLDDESESVSCAGAICRLLLLNGEDREVVTSEEFDAVAERIAQAIRTESEAPDAGESAERKE